MDKLIMLLRLYTTSYQGASGALTSIINCQLCHVTVANANNILFHVEKPVEEIIVRHVFPMEYNGANKLSVAIVTVVEAVAAEEDPIIAVICVHACNTSDVSESKVALP